jgi:hypothetical protein
MNVDNEDFNSALSISWNFVGPNYGDESVVTMATTKLLHRLIERAAPLVTSAFVPWRR